MNRFFTWLSKRRFPYEPLISIEISKGRLINNLNQFRKLAPDGNVAPVLKSNAYGHGLIEIATILANEKVPFFVVDSYFEAVALRAKKIRTPLLIIGYTRPETMLASRLRSVAFTITSIDTLTKIKFTDRPITIHVKIDTGMRRQGLTMEEMDGAISIIQGNPMISLEGLASHFSDADNPDPSFSEEQIALWTKAVHRFKHSFPLIRYLHLSNTDGHRFTPDIEANVSRLGLGLYGIAESIKFSPALKLQPVLEMKTIITGIKKIHAGDTVGYSRTFRADKDMTIGMIPVGYYEGLDRRLSNVGTVLVGMERIPCRIVGRISMNITTIDISKAEGVAIGSPVIVISNITGDPNSIVGTAKLSGIPYEVVVRIPPHLKRVVVE